jgi:predicted GNAT family N-acyltransferase
VKKTSNKSASLTQPTPNVRSKAHYQVKQVRWDSSEAVAIRQVRIAVFVEEQNVPREEEFDAIDPHAYHVVAYDANGQPCGTGRLYPDPFHPEWARIGRMAVLRGARGTGCGAAVMRALLAEAWKQGFRTVVLSAQVHAIGFYQRFGFVPYGAHYLDVNIPHQSMKLVMTHKPDEA